jgi:hypothetical protein
MSRLAHLPTVATLALTAGFLLHGPIPQLANYHAFADNSRLLGIPHAMDVLSNLAFAFAGAWGVCMLLRMRHVWRAALPGYALFAFGLLLTAAGSGYYHLAPDDARLLWDRLPISLTCAGLLAAIRAELHPEARPIRDLLLFTAFAIFGVVWWRLTDLRGAGDLRPYLLLQVLAMSLIPLWQWINAARWRERIGFALAILLYALAKVAELLDHQLLAWSGWLSGHTIKHLLSAAAAGVILRGIHERH